MAATYRRRLSRGHADTGREHFHHRLDFAPGAVVITEGTGCTYVLFSGSAHA